MCYAGCRAFHSSTPLDPMWWIQLRGDLTEGNDTIKLPLHNYVIINIMEPQSPLKTHKHLDYFLLLLSRLIHRGNIFKNSPVNINFDKT